MKNKFIFTCTLIVFVLSITNAYAQGFSSILDKLEKLEKKLTQLEATQKKDITRLKKQLSNVKPERDFSKLDESIYNLRLRMDQLEQKLQVAATDPDNNNNSEIINNLIADLREMAVDLRSSIINHHPDLESIIDKEAHTASKMQPEFAALKDGLKISGFVDASYFYDNSCGDNTFGLDQVEIDLDKSIGNVGSIRTDLEWVNAGTDSFTLKAEQGFVTFNPPFLKSLNFTFGKFNAPIGFELLDAPDMYQYSHALVFDNGLPTNLSGAMFSTNITPKIDLAAYICNGWDLNVDNNTGKTVGGRLGYSMNDHGAIGLSAIRGAEAGPEGDYLTIFDIDATFTATAALTFGGELNTGSDAVGDSTKNWMGFMLMSHYDFTDKVGLTFRYDFFDDKDGTRLGTDIIEKRQASTICPTFSLGAGMGALIEFRYDMSDKEVFVDKANKPAKSMSGIAFEMTYSF